MGQYCLTASGLGARCEQTAPDLLAKSHPGFQVNEQKKGLSAGGSSDVLPPGAGRLPRKSQREWESHAALSWFP